jgi:2-keto-4-pentenoate hydratase/2-oxohepta-3-ene-1,7-dioic acid hydratase in catechol pathway
MRLCRFGEDQFGVVEGDQVRDVTAALADLPSRRYPFPRTDLLIERLPHLRERLQAEAQVAPAKPLRQVALRSPIANAGKVVAAPVNYKKHLEEARADSQIHHQKQVEEIQRVGLFLKATSSIIGPSEAVVIRHPERRTDHEIELAVIIGKPANRVSAKDALDYIAGYCIGLDITVRGPEERSLRKSIDTYTVLGPWFVTADELPDPSALDLLLTVNGETRQKANTRDLIINVPALIEFASSFYTLMPGDVLLTGTPEGVGPIQPGDTIMASISGIGSMQVAVRAD